MNESNKNDNKIAHLNMIQDVIKRLASNSFVTKQWTFTALGALYAYWYTQQQKDHIFLLLILIVTIFLWWHDAYYSHQERRFRDLYNKVRQLSDSKIDFDMTPPQSTERVWQVALSRPILVLTYGLIFVTTCILIYITK